MTGVTWLHLSDWHQQKGKNFDRKIVFRALLKDIRERNKISSDLEKIDFVIFSGDVAFGGKEEEYKAAKEQLFQPILEACGLGPEQLFIVPGNHDLDRDEFKLLPHDLIKPLSTEEEVQDWLTNDRNKSRLLEPFNAFSTFVREYTKQDQPNYVNIKIMKFGDKQIALLGLNSAWMCGRNETEIGDYGLVTVGEPQIYSALDETSGADLKIAVLHHPFDWLREFDRNRVEDQLMQECDFILRGHQHKPKVEITRGTAGDCVIIPAGASYDRRMAENPRYANSYNFVHLDFDTENGAVFLRRWSDEGNRWLEDIASCKGGIYDFNLFKSDAEPSFENTPAPIKLVPHQIPPPPCDFKGRGDEIQDILSNFEEGATITGLRGMGGVGKTALALVLANKLNSRFPDGLIFIDMKGTSTNPINPPMTPEEAMAHVIRAFKPVDRLPENQNELRGLYTSTLTGKKVLLLLDNASSKDQVYPLLPPKGSSVLITSRIKFELFGLVEKDLDILPTEDACELLLEIAPRIGERADELASLCGYLPIALRNAASALAEKKDLKVSDYEQRLKDKVARLELVKRSFSVSYDLLPKIRKKHWRRLSVFPEDFDRYAATALLKMSPEASADALRDLVRWSLVDYIPTEGSEDGRYKLHELARIFAESCLAQGEITDIQQRHANYYSKVLSQADNLYLQGGLNLLEGLKLFDLEWDNIKVGHEWVKRSIRPRVSDKKESKLVKNLAWSYANEGVYILDLRLHPRDMISWFETGLVAARMMKSRGTEEAAMGNLGNAYFHLGETRKAIEFHEKALNIAQEIGDRRAEEANVGNLGNAYANLGETRKAIEFYELALNIAQEIGDRRGEGAAMSNLGNAYANLDKTRKAIEFHEKALNISQEIGDRRGEGTTLGNLGNAHADLGETHKAIEFYELALNISKEIGDRRGGRNALGNLGNAYFHLGETRKAIEFHEKALNISKEIGDRWGEGADLGNLGNAYFHLGETRKATEFYELALNIAQEIGNRRGEGANLNNLGSAYSHLDETRKAIEFYEQSLKISREVGNKKGEGTDLSNLGNAYSHLGETRKATEFYELALNISQEIGDKMGEGANLSNLGNAYFHLGETRKAIEFYEQALSIAKEIGDRKNEAECLCNLGKAYLDSKENDKAIDYCTKSMNLVCNIGYRKIEGVVLCTLGEAFADQGDLEKGLNYCNQALKIFKDIEFSKGEAVALFAKAKTLYLLSKKEEAAQCAQESLQIFQRIESPEAEKVRQQLAEWL